MKEQQSIPVGAEATIMIRSGGDLRVLAHAEPVVVALSREPFSLSAPAPNTAEVNGEGDLEVRVPADARVTISACGGDGRIRDLTGAVRVEQCGGDLGLRQLGAVTVGNVGGDVRVRGLTGPLSIGNTGGDVSLSLAFLPGTEYTVSAGGDIRCNLVTGTSATITAHCGGDISVNARDVRSVDRGAEHLILVGEGDGLVTLNAGGDVVIRDADAESDSIDDLAGSIEALVSRQLSGGMRHVTAVLEKSGLTIQRSLEEASRKVAEAERRAEAVGRRSRRWGVVIPPEPVRAPEPPPPAAHEPVSDDERMTILRLVESGKISAAEAAQLLMALEGK